MADESTSDSPWSSEQEESLSTSGSSDSETDSSTSSSETGFFVNPNRAFDKQVTTCPERIRPINENISRKTKALHLQLFELSEALVYLDHPYLAGRYFETSHSTVWQTAIKALIALAIPQKGKVVKDETVELPAKKAMGESMLASPGKSILSSQLTRPDSLGVSQVAGHARQIP